MNVNPDFDLQYAITELKENYDSREWWRSRLEQRVNAPIQQQFRPRSNAINVLREDWDTLVVLDACRADLFERVISESSLDLGFSDRTSVYSNASKTPEWLHQTFDESHGDIVYVAGNPQVTRHRPNAFHKLFETWRDAYDPDTCTISPETITDTAIKARSDFPDKRLIVHYMQPHYPFIDRPSLNYADYGYDFSDLGMETNRNNNHDDITKVWDALAAGLVTEEDVWEGYSHNLEVVLSEVETVLDAIDDRIIVTSDHGNMFGGHQWPVPLRTYGHPPNLRLMGLVRVPWVVVDGDRRTITDDGVHSSSSATNEEIRAQLTDLGYAE
jgi:hypothetical protein